MKNRLVAGLLAACLISPAFASNSKLVAKAPDEPLHRSTIALTMALFIGLHTYKRRLTKDERVMSNYMR
jgi:hypothetical protein